jgi:redox-regulated HSP33 family molecular chaperone
MKMITVKSPQRNRITASLPASAARLAIRRNVEGAWAIMSQQAVKATQILVTCENDRNMKAIVTYREQQRSLDSAPSLVHRAHTRH